MVELGIRDDQDSLLKPEHATLGKEFEGLISESHAVHGLGR
jgi:hypothetical protein